MNKYLLSSIALLSCPLLFSQILNVNAGSSVSIDSGTSITLDGLEIAPSSAYVISGDNDISRSVTAGQIIVFLVVVHIMVNLVDGTVVEKDQEPVKLVVELQI